MNRKAGVEESWLAVIYGRCGPIMEIAVRIGGVDLMELDVRTEGKRMTELVRRIRLGEDSMLELKSIRLATGNVTGPERRVVADELAAMANSRGGTLVLGVDDRTRRIEGIPLDALDAVEGWIREICIDSVKPALNADILKQELEDGSGKLVPVVVVEVLRSLFVHESPGGYFCRIGSSKRKLAPEALARLFQERSQTRHIRFDESIVPGAGPSDLQYSLTHRFLRSDEGLPADSRFSNEVLDTLRKLCIVADEDGQTRLTLAGTLLCTVEPQGWLHHAYIQAVSYAGDRIDTEYQIDARNIGGPLDEQVEGALDFVRRNMLVRAVKTTARVDRPQFSDRAVFEALVNAVAHRDYSLAGARIRLHMFGDRLELYVPGGLTNTLTPDSLHLRQSNRNEVIVSLLARCSAPSGVGRMCLMDIRGDGVPIIRTECEKLSGKMPEYSLIDESELRLVIPAAG